MTYPMWLQRQFERPVHRRMPEHARAERAEQAWILPKRSILLWCVLLALLMSFQFLAQPFVWRNWPVDEVLLGWLEVARDRIVVATLIGVALVGAGRMRVRSSSGRAALLAAAIVSGSTLGELALVIGGGPSVPDDVRATIGRVLRWCILGATASVMFYLWQRANDLGQATTATELRKAQTERQAAQVRPQALRSQIEPHFLFNTLATVRRLQQTDPAQGTALLERFLDYMRLTLPSLHDQHSTLAQELGLVHSYLDVVATRMSGRLRLAFDVPIALQGCEFPPFALATLVENAVKHGVAPLPAGGEIRVRAVQLGDMLEVSVADTGAGFGGSAGSGIGLANVRARLSTLYGTAGTLALKQNRPTGVCAFIRLPLLLGGDAS